MVGFQVWSAKGMEILTLKAQGLACKVRFLFWVLKVWDIFIQEIPSIKFNHY